MGHSSLLVVSLAVSHVEVVEVLLVTESTSRAEKVCVSIPFARVAESASAVAALWISELGPVAAAVVVAAVAVVVAAAAVVVVAAAVFAAAVVVAAVVAASVVVLDASFAVALFSAAAAAAAVAVAVAAAVAVAVVVVVAGPPYSPRLWCYTLATP
jgi:hypothetical protein